MRRVPGMTRVGAWRSSRGWFGQGGRPGFTLIEVMIALALVLALTALVWASLAPLRDRVAMDEACAMVADGVEQARSMASGSNQVLEVRASIGATALEIQARAIAPAEEEGLDEGAGRGGSVSESDERSWSVLVRIVGSFAREDPMASESGSESGARQAATLADDEPELVSIGIVLPDGSAVPGVPLRLKDADGRWSVVRVGTWTTRIEVEEASAADGTGEGMDEGAEEASMDEPTAGDGAAAERGLDGGAE